MEAATKVQGKKRLLLSSGTLGISDARFRFGIDSGIIALFTGIGIGIKHLENSWNRNRNQTFGKVLGSESES